MNDYSDLRSLPRIGNPGDTRDSQKSKLYKAEAALDAWRGPHHGILLKDLRTSSGVHGKYSSIEGCQEYVDNLTKQRWFQSRWGQRRIEVRLKVYGSASGFTSGHICLPPWARCERVILHEVAHTLTASRHAAHGPEFAAVFLTLVDNHMGRHIGTALRKSFAAKKVKYRTGMALVPKPGTRTVITKTERVEKAKEKDAKLQAERTNYGRTTHAASTIRAHVQAGLFGPPGSKPRVHALATARLLEKKYEHLTPKR
jgi:putative metallohydrolase (TIGR04338 family)